jgi:hypothetical protein
MIDKRLSIIGRREQTDLPVVDQFRHRRRPVSNYGRFRGHRFKDNVRTSFTDAWKDEAAIVRIDCRKTILRYAARKHNLIGAQADLNWPERRSPIIYD